MTTKIGLISDTHTPMRWRDIPPAVYDIFADVDMILHAGDVGELWVLDKLSTIAPVVAVHGNDDSADSHRELPYKQIVTVAGQRILLWHSHAQDRPTEQALRAGNNWKIIQRRLAHSAKLANATTVIYGHTHIAMTSIFDGVHIINPGAIASGNYFQRMLTQSVAILTIADGKDANELVHIDLATQEKWHPPADLTAPFKDAFEFSEAMIISAELRTLLMQARHSILIHNWESINPILAPLAFAVWDGESAEITKPTLLNAIQTATTLDPRDKKTLLTLLN